MAAIETKQLVPKGCAALCYEREGNTKFRDRVTVFYDGKLVFERFCWGEAAGLVFAAWADGVGADGTIQWRRPFDAAVKEIGIPCVVKPIMSSSGHGQSTIKSEADIDAAWKNAQEGGRAGAGKVIVEGFVPFDYEITLLTVRHTGGTTFLKPIGHHQVNGDYQESWQPQPMSEAAIAEAQRIAGLVTGALGGRGIFGVELFICGDKVLFSEVSPRPHDTGMVTMISQDLSEFDLHARAILGLPIPNIAFHGPSASKAIVAEGVSDQVAFEGVDKALEEPDTQVRLFGKPELKGHRRLGVCLARAENVDAAVKKVFRMREKISIKL